MKDDEPPDSKSSRNVNTETILLEMLEKAQDEMIEYRKLVSDQHKTIHSQQQTIQTLVGRPPQTGLYDNAKNG